MDVMDIMDIICNWIIKNILQNKNLISSLFGAFAGAFFAYLLNIWQNTEDTKKRNRANLNNLIVLLSSELVILSGLSEMAQQKLNAVNTIKNKKKFFNLSSEQENESIRIMQESIINSFLIYDLNRIEYITQYEPTLFYFIVQTFKDIENLKNIIEKYNQYNIELRTNMSEPSPYTFENFATEMKKQTNIAIYMSNKSVNNLIIYGKNYFNGEKIICPIIPEKVSSIISSIPEIEGWNLELKTKTLISNKMFPTLKKCIVQIKNKLNNLKEKLIKILVTECRLK